ncbi:MAG: hypothetical protein QXI84_09265 [Thermofilaceae archaeon]
MTDRFLAAALSKALEKLECVLQAKDADSRINCALVLIALTDALGADKKKPPSYTLVEAQAPLLQKMGVEVPRTESLEDALKMRYSYNLETDLYVKALIAASSIVAATTPSVQKLMIPL